MKQLSAIFALALILLPLSSSLGYVWYEIPIAPTELPVYEIGFGRGLYYAGTEAGVYRGFGLLGFWEGMGLDYPGLGAHSILYCEGHGWPKHIVNMLVLPGATGVGIGDFNGGGYADIVVAAKEASDCVVWFENPLPGPVSPFWTMYAIDPDEDGAREVAVGDIDGDYDLDVAVAIRDENRIVWYAAGPESNPVSWVRHDVGELAGPRGVFIADIDEDDHPDIVAGGMDSGTVVWFEAPGEVGNIWIPHVVDTDLAGVKGVFACDIDGDDDIDIVAAGRDAGHVVWYEQIPQDPPGWVKHFIDEDLPGAVSVWCGDLTGDDIPEVAVTSKFAGWVVAYRRSDDTGDLWERAVVDADLPEACPLSAGDCDGDGLTDLVAAGRAAGVLAWYRSPDEFGQFWQKNVIDDAVGSSMGVTVGDLDKDGDCDIVATNIEGEVICYENDLRDIYCAFTEGSGMCESDGIYMWSDIGQEWAVKRWCARPFFITEHPLLAGLYFYGSHEGLFASTDMDNWQELGATVLPDTVQCIWFHPTDESVMMVGTRQGIYRTVPDEPGWQVVDDVPPLPVMDIETGWTQGGPSLPVVIASLGMGSYSDGLYRSLDLGASWETILFWPYPTDLLQDYTAEFPPNDPGMVMFMGTRDDGIYRVAMDGSIVGDLNAHLPCLTIHRMRYDPYIDCPAIYACTQWGMYLCMLLEGGTALPPGEPQGMSRLSYALPNPSRAAVAFGLSGLRGGEPVECRVFDPAGREIWSTAGRAPVSGTWTVNWNGKNSDGRRVPAGVYFYRFQASGEPSSGKVVLLH